MGRSMAPGPEEEPLVGQVPVDVPVDTPPVVEPMVVEPEKRGGADAVNNVTRAAMAWVATVVALVLLVLLIIFIAQNQGPATVRFLGLQAEIGQGIALLIAAVGGGALVALAAGVRILQLRARTRRGRKVGNR